MHDREILLLQVATFPNAAQLPRRLVGLRDHDQAAGLAIESVHEMRGGVFREMQPDAADQTGVFVALGGMAHKAGGLVDHQQFRVLVNDGKQRIQTAGAFRAVKAAERNDRSSSADRSGPRRPAHARPRRQSGLSCRFSSGPRFASPTSGFARSADAAEAQVAS